jgi:hypothetical protein
MRQVLECHANHHITTQAGPLLLPAGHKNTDSRVQSLDICCYKPQQVLAGHANYHITTQRRTTAIACSQE